MEMQKNIPALRFPEFEGEWDKRKLGDIYSEIVVGFVGTVSDSYCDKDNGIPFIRTLNVKDGFFSLDNIEYVTTKFHNANNKSKIYNDDILIARVGANMGQVCNVVGLNTEANSANVIIMKKMNTNSSSFYSLYLNSPYGQRQINSRGAGGAQEVLNISVTKTILSPQPNLPEQTKIATFLNSINERLTQLKQKKTLLEQYKKGVMQKIFMQDIRFNSNNENDYPEWEVKSLGSLAKRMTCKNKEYNTNVLTISAQQGLVSQLEFFNKSVSAKDVSGYYLLKKDDFAYNKSYSNGYPMGAIKRLKYYEKGVVSTLYICFTFNDSVNLSFMEQYFESGIHNQEIEKVAQEGARNHGLLNIGLSDFFSTEIVLPCLDEQTTIANFLLAIDEKINCCTEQISKTDQYKKGLLQQMFV